MSDSTVPMKLCPREPTTRQVELMAIMLNAKADYRDILRAIWDAAPAAPGDARVSGTAAEYLPLHAIDEKRLPGDARWIPISERMPEMSVTVMVADNRSCVYSAWLGGANTWHAGAIEVFPTHWMPLPEPPK